MRAKITGVTKFHLFALGVMLGAFAGILLCYGLGMLSTRYHPIEESKLCYSALTNPATDLQPQTREYLKARLYWNSVVWVSKGWMADWDMNFGPVDEAVLGNLRAVKDASTLTDIYREFLKKYGYDSAP